MDNKKIASILDKYDRDMGQLVPILQDIQAEENYLPKEALIQVGLGMGISLSQVYSVATFFKAFSMKPRGRHLVNVCMGTACHVRGAERVLEKIERDTGIDAGDSTDDGRFSLETVNCVGACALGPIVVIDGDYVGQMRSDKVEKMLKKYE
ncbi:NAD(P)H-dependent oxidoreductase subunit E [Chloroflexota bacterium]